jgi:putative acetyltransferase
VRFILSQGIGYFSTFLCLIRLLGKAERLNLQNLHARYTNIMCLHVAGIVKFSEISMRFRDSRKGEEETVVRLFVSVFSDSEGEEEGKLLGQLARELFESSNETDLFNFVAEIDGQIVGSIFFSRMVFENENTAFILAPVAVHNEHQGKGIGQGLIKYGLGELKACGVTFVITYGNPKFYEKLGFQTISSEDEKPPFELSQPEGWLGLSLGGPPIESLLGNSSCVKALSNPVYW